jgi:hypothetical protein
MKLHAETEVVTAAANGSWLDLIHCSNVAQIRCMKEVGMQWKQLTIEWERKEEGKGIEGIKETR